MATEATRKERVFEEFDDTGMLVKKTVVVDGDQQSSIEINYDRTGKPAVKVKVYDDNSTTIDKRLAEYIAVAEKHSGQKLSPA